MTTTRPSALRLFVPSGLPEGMRIIEKTNWSGTGYVIPRSLLKEFNQRPEAGRPGVYVLTGPDPEDGGADLAYTGEADPLGRRLENVVQGHAVNLAEMDRDEAEGFLDEVLLCCPVLGRREFTASSPDALMRKREQLIRQGVLAKQDNQVELLQDYEFKSPSQAAGLLLARSLRRR